MSKFGILLDAETIQFEQHCALQSLLFLHEIFDKEIMAVEQNGGRASAAFLQTLADAMHSSAVSLVRANQELKTAVEEEYEKRRKDRYENN